MNNKRYVGVIIERRDGRLLFQLRGLKDDTSPNCWGIFGGHLHRGESPITGLKRELYEELRFRPGTRPRLLASFSNGIRHYYIYYLRVNGKTRMKLSDGIRMSWMYNYQFLLKKRTVLSVRMLMLFYPIIKFFRGF